MGLEKKLDQRNVNEDLLNIELGKIKTRNQEEVTRNKIKKGLYVAVVASAFIGGYVFFSKHLEYVSQIKSTINNLIDTFGFY